MPPRFPLVVALGALSLVTPNVAEGQSVALVTEGPEAARASEAFGTFEALGDPSESTQFVVSIDTAAALIEVLRRGDGVRLVRRLEEGTDPYTLAVMASELLEVARAQADPRSVGATVIEPDPDPDPAPDPTPTAAATEPAPHEATPAPENRDWAVEVTPGLGVEAWLSLEGGEPWLVQPTLFVELLTGPPGERWRVGGALFASALGTWSGEPEALEPTYSRHDVGARLTVAGDLGPLDTRLLGHLRAGGAAVVGAATAANGERREATRFGPFLGVGLELRQPLAEGLEAFLNLNADLLPSPVRFTAFGATAAAESYARVGGRLGLGWRLR